jgi:hypothetical protein
MKTRRNRRRIARRHKAIFVTYFHLLPRDPTYGSPAHCYVCGRLHNALALVRIEDQHSTTIVPLCGPCLAADERANAVTRHFLSRPELQILHG